MKKNLILVGFFVLFAGSSFITAQSAQNFPQGATAGRTSINAEREATRIPFINFEIREPANNREVAFSVQLLLLLTVLSLAPSLLLLTTSFLRISIVLDFIKRALSLQQVPPTQVLNGIALFLTLFIMWPTFTEIYDTSFKPLSDGTVGIEQAYQAAEKPVRLFMYKQMASDTSTIALFMSMAKMDKPETLSDVPTHILIPAYILHELTAAFKIGILLYLPFIIVDMVVASILMSMGMIMLPPVQISMPFKLILFILVDGWGLLTQQLFNSFV
ncbi:MAG TPA: flagellar type III secretion system pore protein FliP [Treponemataceae bacterium]|jgi:flagellar biosynthetic protein FliP|nr:flagellar type III secretion system pore protein FliP [Treponemataceae bacterium]HQL33880.1 flagellar type III secretion system pore protein FliP [Treponemataceae bacterium]